MATLKYQLLPEAGRQVLSVAELTRSVRLLLESNFSSAWVRGEVSNFKFHSSGHMYFSLKDEEAQINCVMFRQHNQALGFDLADGRQVLCQGRVSVYAPRGQYQLMVERVEPQGVGALQLRFEQLKEKLNREGLFEQTNKKEIPFLPSRVALVTSTDGAALRDILQVLDRRFSLAHLLIYPVPVQGPAAAPAIAEAIEDLNRERVADVMILARGGGSLEDLWAFNEETVARAIFRSDIPVISAVGHETDFTIADFVADLRAPTPSAAAEMVLPVYEDVLARIEELKARSVQAAKSLLKQRRERWKVLAQSRALKDPLDVFATLFQRLDEQARALSKNFLVLVAARREKAGVLIGKLEALGPLATLKRGFSATFRHPEGTLVGSVRTLKAGESVRTRLKDGSFISKITEVRHE